MVTFNLSRSTAQWIPGITSYRMTVTVTSAVGAPKEIFIIKRTTNYVNDQPDDVFAAVATPAQLEDFPVGEPGANSSFYRANRVDLVVRTAEGMEAIFDSLAFEVEKLAKDIDVLTNTLTGTQTYTISGSSAP